MLKNLVFAFLGIIGLALIPGCGIKGPLYLPSASQSQAQGAAQDGNEGSTAKPQQNQDNSSLEIKPDPDNGDNTLMLTL